MAVSLAALNSNIATSGGDFSDTELQSHPIYQGKRDVEMIQDPFRTLMLTGKNQLPFLWHVWNQPLKRFRKCSPGLFWEMFLGLSDLGWSQGRGYFRAKYASSEHVGTGPYVTTTRM